MRSLLKHQKLMDWAAGTVSSVPVYAVYKSKYPDVSVCMKLKYSLNAFQSSYFITLALILAFSILLSSVVGILRLVRFAREARRINLLVTTDATTGGYNKEYFIQKESGLYLSCALAFIIIAFGSGITMFFIPSSGLRPSFLNLVFLIISAALLFRLQELNDYFFVDNHGAFFLKSVGCLYLVVTMSFSLWGSYINRCYLNDILVQVREASTNSIDTFLEFKPPVTMQNDMWFYGSGIHLVPLPVSTDESHEFNKAFSYFYGIKGIKIR